MKNKYCHYMRRCIKKCLLSLYETMYNDNVYFSLYIVSYNDNKHSLIRENVFLFIRDDV